jgi:hypothetical protein
MEGSGDVSPVEYLRGSRARLQKRARELEAEGNPASRLYSREAARRTVTIVGLLAIVALAARL